MIEAMRRQTGVATRFVIMGATATASTIGDPKDELTLNVPGFQADVVKLALDFVAGRF